MGQSGERIRNEFFSRAASFTRYPPFCIFYKIIFILESFQPIFIKLGMYVKVKETYSRKKIQVGPI